MSWPLMEEEHEGERERRAYRIVLEPLTLALWNGSESLACSNPKFGMDLILRYDFTL